MSKSVEIALLTTPATIIRADLPAATSPFRRIVGVGLADTLITLPQISMPQEACTAQHRYTVPDVFARRLARYFWHQFSGERIVGDPDRARNCFQFGIWMTRGIAYSDREKASEQAFQEARTTPLVTDDQIGDFSVIRSLRDMHEEPVLHGGVKLSDVGEYIELTTRGGVLAVTTMKDALAYRETKEYREKVVQPCFGVDPTTWAVGHFSVSDRLRRDY